MQGIIHRIKKRPLILGVIGAGLLLSGAFGAIGYGVYQNQQTKQNLEPGAFYIAPAGFKHGKLYGLKFSNEDRDRNGLYETYSIDEKTGIEYRLEREEDGILRFHIIKK